MRNGWILIGAMLVGSALAGCSGSSPDAGSTATHPAQIGSDSPQTMTSRDDLISPHALVWDSWRESTPTTIEITFLTGPASCTGVHATVTETPQDVTIDLTEGALPGNAQCQAIALTSITTVNLTQPLNDRIVRQSAG